MKKVGIVILVLLGIFAFWIFAVVILAVTPVGLLLNIIPTPDRVISGTVVDCDTNSPVSGAQVLKKRFSWGVGEAGYLVWDKPTISTAITDESGNFQLNYEDFSKDFKLTVSNNDHYNAVHLGRINGPITVRILAKGEIYHGATYDCKTSEECLKTTMEDGVQVS